jgi:aryl-alcohol dehydrogenase-like predicted oxidoreductase
VEQAHRAIGPQAVGSSGVPNSVVTRITLASGRGRRAKLSGVQQRVVGKSGLKVSELGLGTLTWGRESNADDAAAQLIAFHDAGGTLIDTAVSYSAGAAEEILGQLLADVVPRDDLVIATKAGLLRVGDDPVVDASRRGMLARLDASLTRLGVDHVDLWQLHVPDDTVPIEETLAALDYAVSSGKARYVGVSNFSGWRLAQAASWQRSGPGRAPIVSNQVRYSLLERNIEREVVPGAQALGVGVLAYSPLGGGVLTGKYRDGVPTDSRAAAGYRNLADFRRAEEAGIVEAVATAAEGLATAPIAVALAWVRDQPAVSSVILGARTLGQLTAALSADSLVLPIEISRALDDVSAPVIGYPERVF